MKQQGRRAFASAALDVNACLLQPFRLVVVIGSCKDRCEDQCDDDHDDPERQRKGHGPNLLAACGFAVSVPSIIAGMPYGSKPHVCSLARFRRKLSRIFHIAAAAGPVDAACGADGARLHAERPQVGHFN